jgi:dynein heavy chain
MVPALPNHLLFVFGGSSDFFEEGTPRTFANLSNTAQYISIAGDLKQSTWSPISPEEPIDDPPPRENSTMVYDESNNRLLIFGGWSNKYMNDVHELNISSITGPQYAIYDIEPKLGPYTGNTNCMITGEGFVPNRSYVVEFKAGKNALTSSARYVSPTQIECVTPEFVSVGPKEASVKVRAERGDLTLTDVPFHFFLNTKFDKTIAFGPGLLAENKVGVETIFYIQTRNIKNENRTSGRDNFEIQIYTESEEVEENEEGEEIQTTVQNPIEYKIEDLDNGQYKIEYTSDKPAEVFLDIQYSSEVQKAAQIRGGPFKATFTEDAPAENNTFTGPSMQKYISSRLNEIDTFIHETSEGIDTSD